MLVSAVNVSYARALDFWLVKYRNLGFPRFLFSSAVTGFLNLRGPSSRTTHFDLIFVSKYFDKLMKFVKLNNKKGSRPI